jgi:hypothetical protein
VEKSVKRLRKPEDVAELGEANPAEVATCFFKRRRAKNLKRARESRFVKWSSHDTIEDTQAVGVTDSERDVNDMRGRS